MACTFLYLETELGCVAEEEMDGMPEWVSVLTHRCSSLVLGCSDNIPAC